MSFTASNGVVLSGYGTRLADVGWAKLPAIHEARKEMYQLLRDKELGRWRWPESSRYVVYYHDSHADVLDEVSGRIRSYTRSEAYAVSNSDSRQAARAYFEAHRQKIPATAEYITWLDDGVSQYARRAPSGWWIAKVTEGEFVSEHELLDQVGASEITVLQVTS
ncbi:hypothetical protein [Microbacterium sp. YY-01]|uniref:hypothetical protein n=1 Tax=Microbacterium sp. YY-01 TaxID=3421634 RepID=UPI003D1728C6